MRTSQDFANLINNFDMYFEFSDSEKAYSNGKRAQKAIKETAAQMTTEELMEARKLITVEQELIDRYFAGLFPEIAPEPSANSELFTIAWTIKKLGLASSFSEALKKAWIIMKIKLAGNVAITFAKETGEVRAAKALSIGNLDTLSKGFVRYVENINGTESWRSFRIDRLMVA
ncbi:MAG: hypothetical protein KDC49_22985 [Saprospiraceae bacterium]|nr:hypothetical protein [Saprospiraceae bacterium]